MASSTPSWADMEAKYKQDIEALTESVEMATIEREIAEEKLDSCQREIQELKEKLEAATTTSEPKATSPPQDEVLKQALIKLRDMSAKDQKALEDLQIEHQELQVKFLDLEEKVKTYEEQIDISQSAQEMVEKLSQQKTELEDKLKEMIHDFDAMDKLRDLNEQLLESARQNEIELTGEIDNMRVQGAKLTSRIRDLEDYLTDQERSLAKIKDENRTMREELFRLKEESKVGESIDQQRQQIENVGYKLKLSESKMAEKEAEINRYKRNLAEMEDQMQSLSLITKEQSERLDQLKLQYENKCSENSGLQRALKKKLEEVSEIEIRRAMVEKKLQSVQKDNETMVANLTRQIEAMKGMEIRHEEDMKRLMEDNELIEHERRKLREQLNRSRSLEKKVQPVTAQETSLAFATTPKGDDTVFMRKIRELSAAFDLVARKNYDLEMEFAYNQLGGKVPPYNSPASINLESIYDIDRAKKLRGEMNKLKRELRAAMINQQICTKSRDSRFKISQLLMRYHNLEQEASDLMSNSRLSRQNLRMRETLPT